MCSDDIEILVQHWPNTRGTFHSIKFMSFKS